MSEASNAAAPVSGSAAESRGRSSTAALYALLAGNFITGLAVLAPTGMLGEISSGLDVSVPAAGLLVTFGAVLLCLGSPLMVWATAALDRRLVLGTSLALVAVCHLASAAAPSYAALLGLRLLMLLAAAIFTPQAASTVALMVPDRDRARAISLVFLGWSLSIAAGLPLVALLATHLGWRAGFGFLGLAALAAALFVALAVPSGLRGVPLSLASWGRVVRNRRIVLLLSITALWMSGYFTIFAYVGPLLSRLTGASPNIVAAVFALVGVMGFLGNVGATRMVDRLGQFNTALVFLLSLFLGTLFWALGAGSLPLMGVGAAFLGLGFAAFNSITQGRLVSEAPAFASASVALNTSCIYIGQALGSGIAVAMFSRGQFVAMGYVAAAFMTVALFVLARTRRSVTVIAPAAVPVACRT